MLFLLSVLYLAKTMFHFKPAQDTVGVKMRAREKEGGVKIAAFVAAWLPSPYCGPGRRWEKTVSGIIMGMRYWNGKK